MPELYKDPKKEEYFQLAKTMFNTITRLPKNVLGVGRSIDGSSDKFDITMAEVDLQQERVNKFSVLGAIQQLDKKHIEDYLKKSFGPTHNEQERNDKIDAAKVELKLRSELIEKLIEEEKEKDRKIREQASAEIAKTQDFIKERVEEVESDNRDAGKYRLLASLIFFGIFDVLHVLALTAENFGQIDEKFYEAVGDVLTNHEIMNFFANINQVFQIDKIAEGIGQLPILEDINQFSVDLLTSEYLGPITSTGVDVLDSDFAEYLLKAGVLAWAINSEVEIGKNFDKVDEQTVKAKDECREKIKEAFKESKIAKRAEDIIKRETEIELGSTIYFKALNIHPELNMTDSLKGDLKKIGIYDKDGTKKSNALEFLTTTDQNTKTELLRHHNNVENLKRLERVATKHREDFNEDKEVKKDREALLKRFVDKLNLKTIKNVLTGIGDDNAKNIGEAIDDRRNEGIVKAAVIKDVIEKMGNKDGDEVIKALAVEAKRDETILKINRGHEEKSGNENALLSDFIGRTGSKISGSAVAPAGSAESTSKEDDKPNSKISKRDNDSSVSYPLEPVGKKSRNG